MVRISGFHPDDPGSIPGTRKFLSFDFFVTYKFGDFVYKVKFFWKKTTFHENSNFIKFEIGMKF